MQVQAGNLLEVYAKLAHAAKRLESQIHRVQAEAVAVQQQQQQQVGQRSEAACMHPLPSCLPDTGVAVACTVFWALTRVSQESNLAPNLIGVSTCLQGLESAMQAVTQHLSRQDAAVSQDCQAARAALQVATQRLQLELSSAGNIWLEEGRSGDAWMQSCQELLSSSCLQLGGHVQVC